MKTADEWYRKGLAELDLSRGADSTREYYGDLEDAVAAFDQALALDRSFPGANRERGFALATLGRHEAALDAFIAARALEPEDAGLELAVAQSLAKLGQPEAALGAFETVLRLRPGDDEALFGRAEALTALQRDELALAAWDAVVAGAGTRNITMGGLTVRVLTGDFRRLKAQVTRSLLHARLGRPEALAVFRQLFDAEASGLHSQLAPAAFHDALRDFEIAREAYRQHLAAHAGEPATWSRAGATWSALGRTAEANEAFEQLVRLTPTNAHAWYAKAEAHAKAQQYEQAIAAYRQSLALWPEFLGAAARLRVVEQDAHRARGGSAP